MRARAFFICSKQTAKGDQKGFGGLSSMTLFRSFLLGSVAVIVTGVPSFAADMDALPPLPVLRSAAPIVAAEAPEPPPPPANCKDKKGYYIVPNSQTCLKINGMIRGDVLIHSNNIAEDYPGWVGDFQNITAKDTTNDVWNMATTARFGADTVTETSYGKLRGNILLQATPAGTKLRYGFIEWNNFTVGHTESFFYPDGEANVFFGAVGDYGSYRRTLFGYTAKFNDTISTSLSLEDHDSADQGDGKTGADEDKSGQSDILLSPLKVANDSTQLPDLIGNIVGKGDWGLLYVSGALGNYRTIEGVSKEQDSFMGWALGVGGTANLDMITKGDQFQAKFGYADGALSYITGDGRFAHAIVDTTANNIETASGWSAQGSFLHFWVPTINSTLFGGYTAVDYTTDPVNTHAVIEGKPIDGWNVGGNLQWQPVGGMTIGTEVAYGGVTRAHDGAPDTSDNAWSGVFRVQRNF
jgi:hypothetical protein